MLHVVGLGLWDERDISVRGLEIVRRCAHVYLEAYTSILLVEKEKLEALYGREVQLADREMVESGIEAVLDQAKDADVAFLVVGDPFGATTHTDLVLRARHRGIPVSVVHNASVMNAIGATGLQLYRFGETVSIPFFSASWQPDSFYDRIKGNRDRGLHTLCLLDIKVKEPSLEAMSRGKIRYEAPRYMTVNTAIKQLLMVEERRKENAYSPSSLCVGVSRLGAPCQFLAFGRLDEVLAVDCGAPLHSLLLCGEMHEMETEFLEECRVGEATPRLVDRGEEEEEEREREREIL